MVRIISFLFFLGASSAFAQMTGDPGFFLEDWKPKKFKGFPGKTIEYTQPEKATVTVEIDFKDTITKVSPYLNCNNAGIWMGSASINNETFVEQLRRIKIPVIRFPGGNLANDYFWDAADPSQLPPGVPDTINRHFQKKQVRPPKLANYGTWALKPSGFYDLLLRTGANASICVNYSYALYSTLPTHQERVAQAAHYAAEWVRDVNVKRKLGIKFWEVGNENWGTWQAGYFVGGRGFISPKQYGKDFCVFVDSMKAADPTIKIGVVGYQKPKGSDPKGIMNKWNREVFPEALDKADYIVLHSYFTKYGKSPTPEEMLQSIDNHAAEHINVVNKAIETYTDKKANHLPIALTEFNTHSIATISKQDGASNVSHTAGVFFSYAMCEFARQGYGMTIMWDILNGYADGKDHGMFASDKESDVPLYNPHPSYYHYYFFDRAFGDRLYKANSSSESMKVFPTTFKDGQYGLVIINKSSKKENVKVDLGAKAESFKMYKLHNDDPLSRKVYINGKTTSLTAGGPQNIKKVKPYSSVVNGNSITIDAEPISATYIVLETE